MPVLDDLRRRFFADESGRRYKVGDWVQYSSTSRDQWLPARVLHTNDDEMTLEVTCSSGLEQRTVSAQDSTLVRSQSRGPAKQPAPEGAVSPLDRTRTRSGTLYQVGNQIEYADRREWVPAVVTSVGDYELTVSADDGRFTGKVSTATTRHRSAREIQRLRKEERRRTAKARKEEQKRTKEEHQLAKKLRQKEGELRSLTAELSRLQAAGITQDPAPGPAPDSAPQYAPPAQGYGYTAATFDHDHEHERSHQLVYQFGPVGSEHKEWCDFGAHVQAQLRQAHDAYKHFNGAKELRVHTGSQTYIVNFLYMEQTNTRTGTRRPIRLLRVRI